MITQISLAGNYNYTVDIEPAVKNSVAQTAVFYQVLLMVVFSQGYGGT